jgi:hypothetical protein
LLGAAVHDYVVGSLALCARHPSDLPRLAPRALDWYRALLAQGLVAPFGVVLDVGCLLLEGEAFRFRGFFADGALRAVERDTREAYEQRVLMRRLHESAFARLQRLLRDSREPDAVIAHVLALLLQPTLEGLTRRYLIDRHATIDLAPLEPATARRAFEEEMGQSDALLEQLADLTLAASSLNLDERLAEEDFYELAHIRLFTRPNLRHAARHIKTAERLIGPTRRFTTRALRDRALAATTMESIGTYPMGGIAELATRGPIENLVPSELVWLEPEQQIDPFLVRFAENELLRYLRDSAVLHLMRHTVVFYVDECHGEFWPPPMRAVAPVSIQARRWLLGLVMALVGDLRRVFARDDVTFEVRLLRAEQGDADTEAEAGEMAEVTRLLLSEQEEAGRARVELLIGDLADDAARWRPESGRFLTVIAFSRPERLAALSAARRGVGVKLLPVPVHVEAAPAATGPQVVFAGDLVEALRAARDRILEQVFA